MNFVVLQSNSMQPLGNVSNLSMEHFYKETIQLLMMSVGHIHDFWRKYKKNSMLPSILDVQPNTNEEILVSSEKIFRDQWW